MTILSGMPLEPESSSASWLGAHAVMLGRAPLHGVAAAGEAGALRALQIYHDEIDRVLALVGCSRLDQLTRDHVQMPAAE